MVLVLKNPPANAGGYRFDPWSGKIPHALGQLSLCTTTTEALSPRAHVPQQKKPLQIEARAPKLERNACSPHLEEAHAQQQGPSAMKNK